MRRQLRKITHAFKGIGISLENLSTVTSRRGLFGHIALFHHPELGKVFVLDGEIQHVEAWAPLYHEPLVHLPVAFLSEVKNVLILGGGTLYAASEVLKYRSVERVVLVDHDPLVTETVAKYYKHAQACLKDRRFTLSHENAYTSVLRSRSQFDLIINDGADLLGVKHPRFTGPSALLSVMANAVKPHGVCADVVYRHLFERQRTIRTLKTLQRRNRHALSLVFLPDYHGVLHVLCVWGKKSSSITQTLARPKNEEQLQWITDPSSCPCTYYDPRFLRYYLYLPRYLNQALATKKTIS